MKRENKRNRVKAFRSGVSKLMVFQKIVFSALTLFKRPGLKLNPKFSHILQYINQLKTKVNMIVHYVLRFGYQLKRKRTIIALALSTFFVFNLFVLNPIGAQLLYSTSLQSYGGIKTIGVVAYNDSSCMTSISEVNWGMLTPGLSNTSTFYIKNEGNSDLMLSLDTTNWNPTNAHNYMTLSWNYEGQTIRPNQVIQISLTLSVSQNINGIDSFNFEITIMGTN